MASQRAPAAQEKNPEFSALVAAQEQVESALGQLTESIGKAQRDISAAAEALRAEGVGRAPPQTLAGRDTVAEVGPDGKAEALRSSVTRSATASTSEGAAVAVARSSGRRKISWRSVSWKEDSQEVDPRESQGATSNCSNEPDQEFVAETLPHFWPKSLKMKKGWEATRRGSLEDSPKERRGVTRALEWALEPSGVTTSQSISLSQSFASLEERGRRWTIINPHSTNKMFYDGCAILCMALDFMLIPFVIGWDINTSENDALAGVMMVVTMFWTLDIIVSFRTAYLSRDELVFDSRRIACNYLRSWFIADLSVVLCDWATLLASQSLAMRTVRFAKLGRLVRLASTFRVMKFGLILERLWEMYGSASLNLVTKLFSLCLITLSVAHVLACFWFLIGRLQLAADTGTSWIMWPGWLQGDIPTYSGMASLYQYATCFHWAMAHLTLGAMEVYPTTSMERYFSVACLLLGLLFGSTLVSTLSAAFFEVQMNNRDTKQKTSMMRTFLRENGVDRRVAVQVESQLSERLAIKEPLSEEQVTGLKLLSESLKGKIRYSMFEHYMTRHALLRVWVHIDPALAQMLCRKCEVVDHNEKKCLEFQYLRNQDDLFHGGKPAESVYLLISGRMEYVQEPDSSPVLDSVTEKVEEGTWLAEPALWAEDWIHVGTAHATAWSKVLKVNVNMVLDIAKDSSKNPAVRLTQDYCHNFHRRLQTARPPASSWPTDLVVPFASWGEIVVSMSKESQKIIGEDALKQAAQGRSAWTRTVDTLVSKGLDTLAAEVAEGRSTVVLNEGGELRRMVSVVALSITRGKDSMLVQVGKRKSGGGALAPAIAMPGCKQEHGETVMDTVDRLKQSKLSPIASKLEVYHHHQLEEEKESAEHAVLTTYYKKVVHTKLHDADELEPLRLPPARDRQLSPTTPGTRRADSGFERAIGVDPQRAVSQDFRSTSREFRSNSKGVRASADMVSKGMTRVNSHALRRQQSRRGDVPYVDVGSLLQGDAFLICNGGSDIVYSWVPVQEYELLQGKAHQDVVTSWIASLNQRLEEMAASRGTSKERGSNWQARPHASVAVGVEDPNTRAVTCRGNSYEIDVTPEGSGPETPRSAASDPANEADIPPLLRGDSRDDEGFRSFFM